MGRLLIGSLAAAAAMFAIAFILFATPLSRVAFEQASAESSAQIQAGLATLPRTGTYAIPNPEVGNGPALYAQGPVALVRVNKGGFPVFDPAVLVQGYIHMAVAAFVFALALYLLSHRLPTMADRATLVGWTVLGSTIFNQLGDPIWYRVDWRYSLYVFVANAIVLTVGGLILARWFTGRDAALHRG